MRAIEESVAAGSGPALRRQTCEARLEQKCVDAIDRDLLKRTAPFAHAVTDVDPASTPLIGRRRRVVRHGRWDSKAHALDSRRG